MNRRVLITGCNGFIGSKAVARFLAAGDEVFGLDKFGDPAAGIRFVRDSVSAEGLASFGVEFDAILHFAGTGSVRAAAADLAAARRDTVDASVAVLDYLRQHPRTKMIYASSAAVYGNAGGILSEDLPCNPISAYGELKAEVEGLCRDYHDKYGCRINVIRPFSIYGCGLRKQLLWDSCGRVAEAKSRGMDTLPCFGTGKEERDFVNVEDVVSLVAHLIEQGPDWSVVNCGTGVATPVNDVLKAICREMNFNGRLDYDNQTRTGDPLTLIADIGRLRKLGFAPKTPFSSGVTEFVRWYVATGEKLVNREGTV